MLPIRRLRLNVYAIDAVEHIEVVHIDRTGISLHRGEDIRQRYTRQLHFIPVHIKIELWYVRLQGRGKPGEFLALGRVIHQSIGCLHQIVECGVSACFKLHLETSRTAQSRNDRWRRQIDLTLRILLQVFLHLSHDFVNGLPVSCFPRFHDNGQFATCLTAAYTRAATYYALHIFHCRVLHQILYGTFRNGTRAFQCRPLRQFQFHFEISLIFYRQEAGRY